MNVVFCCPVFVTGILEMLFCCPCCPVIPLVIVENKKKIGTTENNREDKRQQNDLLLQKQQTTKTTGTTKRGVPSRARISKKVTKQEAKNGRLDVEQLVKNFINQWKCYETKP